MEGPSLGHGGEDITWPDQVAPRGRKASSTCKIKPQTSNLKPQLRNIESALGGGGIGNQKTGELRRMCWKLAIQSVAVLA